MNPIIHTESSMTKFGGKTEKDFNQFLAIHEKMDVSKHYYPNNKHRALTHTMFWVKEVMLPIFGSFIILSSKEKISIKDICEQHILEDYGMIFIPTPQDFLDKMEFQPWMDNGKRDEVNPSGTITYPDPIPNAKIRFPKSGSLIDWFDKYKDIIPPHNPYPGHPWQWPNGDRVTVID